MVLPGEASHGTSEFYRARAAITKRLVEKHGITIVAVEADWPDTAAVPAISHMDVAQYRVAAFVDWLRQHNASVADRCRMAGFDINKGVAEMRATNFNT